MRNKDSYEAKYGKELGGQLLHALQQKSGASSRIARIKKKLAAKP
jgi:hypothetical protein